MKSRWFGFSLITTPSRDHSTLVKGSGFISAENSVGASHSTSVSLIVVINSGIWEVSFVFILNNWKDNFGKIKKK